MRGKLKKVGAFLFLLAITATVGIIYASASDVPKLSISDNLTAERGDTVSFDVVLENDKEFNGVEFGVLYDKDTFELVDADYITLENGFTIPVEDEGNLVYSFALLEGKVNYSGRLVTITLKVKDDAQAGEHAITFYNAYMSTGESDDEEYVLEGESGSIFVDVPVQNVSLVQDSFTLEKGTTDNIEIDYSPSDTTTAKNYSFTSNNNDIVTVDEDGVMSAVGNGSTTIDVEAFGETFEVDVTVETSINKVTLDETNIEMAKGEEKTISATVEPSDTTMSKELTWESSNPDVVTVDENGKIEAISGGRATITATSVNGVSASLNVVVNVPITNATINKESLTMNKGDEEQLEVTIEPSDATDQKITWTTDDDEVATVDENGKVTAVGAGETTITAKVGSFTLTTDVEVVVPIEKIELNETSIEMLPTQEKNLSVIITPNDTTEDTTVRWESNNPDVVSVDNNGVISALEPGNATITATVGSFSVSAEVKVLIPIDNIVISNSDVRLNKGGTEILTIQVYPENAEEDTTVTWESSNTNVATIDSNGKVTAVGGGNATITGTLKNGKKVTAEVTVTVPIENVTVNYTNLELEKGKSEQLDVTINPSDTTENTTVTWESSNTNVATIDSNGKVTAVGRGNAIITGTLENGMSVETTVNVIVPITSVTLDRNNISMNKGTTTTLVATINPNDTTEDTTKKWESSNTNVVTVDENGMVTAVGRGSAEVTVTVGNKKATATIEVLVPITSVQINKDKVEVVKNQTVILSAIINPSDTTEDTTVTWESDDPSIATVDENGVVTGKSEGVVVIRGTLQNGMEISSEVTVTIIPVDSISFEDKEITILKGKETLLNVLINPSNATEIENIAWESSDDTIITVDENGRIRGLKAGTATITARMGNLSCSIDVTIEEVHLTDIIIGNDLSNIHVGDSFDLELILNPANTTDELTFTYVSSNEDVITIDENGHLVAKAAGKSTITVTASNGVQTSYEVNVTKLESPDTGVQSISLYGMLSLILLGGIGVTIRKIKA